MKSEHSRAPPASSDADNMGRAVWGNSRSAVISGPRSERASTVRSRRRKLSFCNAKRWGSKNQSRKRVTRTQLANLLVSLVHSREEWHRARGLWLQTSDGAFCFLWLEMSSHSPGFQSAFSIERTTLYR